MAWQRDSGYNQRACVEGQIARWKQVIGDGLRFHSDEARATEVAIAAAGPQPNARPPPELRPRRLINRREWGLLCLFLLPATRWRGPKFRPLRACPVRVIMPSEALPSVGNRVDLLLSPR